MRPRGSPSAPASRRSTSLLAGLSTGACCSSATGSSAATSTALCRRRWRSDALDEVAFQYVIAFAGRAVLAAVLGWLVAGRVLAPLKRITGTARRVSEEHLDERIPSTAPTTSCAS